MMKEYESKQLGIPCSHGCDKGKLYKLAHKWESPHPQFLDTTCEKFDICWKYIIEYPKLSVKGFVLTLNCIKRTGWINMIFV